MVAPLNLPININEYINSPETPVCRLCLRKFQLTDLEDIFKQFQDETIAEYAIKFANINIIKEDCFSKVICKHCLTRLEDIEDFKKFIYGCNEFLNNLYTHYILKVERTVADGESNQSLVIPVSLVDETWENEEREIEQIFMKCENNDDSNNNNILEKVQELKEEDVEDDVVVHALTEADLELPLNHSYRPNQQISTEIVEKTIIENLKCKQCGKQFGSVYAIKNHLETHTDNPNYQCDMCGKRFRHPITFNAHKRYHNRKVTEVTCEICHKSIRSIRGNGIKSHMQRHLNDWKQLCPQCGKTFTSRDGYKTHLKKHNGELDFKCELCPKKYSSRKGLREHTAAVHSPVKPYSCEICGKTFALKTGWYRHGQVHAKENPFTCTICEKRFGYPSHLKGHLNVVHGVREK